MLRHRAAVVSPWPTTPVGMHFTAPVPRDNSTSGDGHHGGKGHGDTLQEWSSLIGIVTAIVGNVLIALALNVQRYAHTRLHKERARVRQRARAALKRSKTANQAGSYGTLGGSRHGNGDRDSPNSGLDDRADGNGSHVPETEPLTASFHSDATNDTQAGDADDDDKYDSVHGHVASTYLQSPYWWLGQVLITLGEMGNFLAYGFAPASIVSPLGVVALVSNCIIAPVMFHERFRQRDFFGVVVAVGGVVTVVLSANTEETKLDPHAVWDAITTLEFEIYLGVTVGLIILLMWASRRYGGRTILIDLGLVGLFGGYTALATKGVSSMLSSTLWRAFTTPVTYVLLFILLGTAVMQIRYVNKALQRFDSTQVIPIQFVMFTLCVILGSAILYRDFEKTTAEQAGKFVGGCLLTFFGVFLITSGRQSANDDDDDDDDILSDADGVEETIGLAHHDGNAPRSAHGAPSTPGGRSRRSSRLSRVSFADTIRPVSPKGHQIDNMPSLRYTDSEGSESSFTPGSAPLPTNPWHEEVLATSPPRSARTVSADSVTTASAFTPHPPIPTEQTRAQPGPGADRSATPRPPLSPFRSHSQYGNSNRSGTFINPSPLSSTVTNVFKDGFLRGRDDKLAKRTSMRRLRSSIRASLFFNDGEHNDEDAAAAAAQSEGNISQSLNDDHSRPGGADAESDPSRARSRSVSETLGDLFRPSKKPQRDQVTRSEEV